jgi:hypothetical protein
MLYTHSQLGIGRAVNRGEGRVGQAHCAEDGGHPLGPAIFASNASARATTTAKPIIGVNPFAMNNLLVFGSLVLSPWKSSVGYWGMLYTHPWSSDFCIKRLFFASEAIFGARPLFLLAFNFPS